ncbi:MAG: cytochrome c oxidase subunit 3 [Candidatus Hydrogenedentota bacterium]
MSDVTMGPAKPIVSDHFVDKEQQNEASFIGMWLFLAQEAMFFGGLFVAYAVYRFKYPDVWEAGSAQLNVWFGAGNTIVLLASSVTMALCVWSTQSGYWKRQVGFLCATIGLGIVFLGVKWVEYAEKWDHGLVPVFNWHPHAEGLDPVKGELFFSLYFIMTGMHAFHMIIGFGIGAVYIVLCLMKKFGPNMYLPVEFFGFYWHFVDIVWVFLFPMLYLV